MQQVFSRDHPASPVFWARPQDPAFWADLEARSALPSEPAFWRGISSTPEPRAPELLRRLLTSDPADRHPPVPAPRQTGAQDWYHGTAADIRAFDPGRVTQTTGFSRGEGALKAFRQQHDSPTYMARDVTRPGQPMADWYANKALPAKRNKISGADDEGVLTMEDIERLAHADAGPNVMPLRFRAERMHEVDWGGFGTNPDHWYGRLIEHTGEARAKFGGQDPDVLVLRNVRVEKAGPPRAVDSPLRPGEDDLIDVAVVWEPNKIRSIFARFDPAKVSSADLLAALAGAGLLMPLGRSAEREERATPLSYPGGA